MNALLNNVLYGNELDGLESAAADLDRWFGSIWQKPNFFHIPFPQIISEIDGFFRHRKSGVWGGPITAGDALFVVAFMAAIRPDEMIEIGVASGFSSSLILKAAQNLGLAAPSFLHSFDIADSTDIDQQVGCYLCKHHPELTENWQLNAPATSLDFYNDSQKWPCKAGSKVLAFVDGGHEHPWPAIDILALQKNLPKGSWIIMQDYQIVERWFADTIRFDVPMETPQRGVNLAVSLWPGTKLIGQGLCYNMAAICLDAPEQAIQQYRAQVIAHKFECLVDGNHPFSRKTL